MTSNNTPRIRTVKFETAVTRGIAAQKSAAKAQWIIGDLALTIDTTVYGSGTVQKFSDEIGMPYKTVMDMRKVSSRYAAPERSELNGWSVHQAFAGQEDRADLVSQKVWTAKEAQEVVKSRRTPSTPKAVTRESLVARIERLRADLADAEVTLAAYDTEHASDTKAAPATKASTKAAPATKASTKAAPATKASTKPARHFLTSGIPAHDATDARTDCSECTTAAQLSIPSKSVRHARRTAKAGV